MRSEESCALAREELVILGCSCTCKCRVGGNQQAGVAGQPDGDRQGPLIAGSGGQINNLLDRQSALLEPVRNLGLKSTTTTRPPGRSMRAASAIAGNGSCRKCRTW